MLQLTMILAPVPLLVWWTVKLIRSGLHRRYKLLTLYLVWSAVMALAAAGMNMSGSEAGYRVLFFLYRSGDWALSIAVLLELFRLAVEVSPALANAGKWFANLATAATILGGVALAASGSSGGIDLASWIVYERSFYISIIALSVMMLAFVALFRVRERRNVVVLACLFAYLFSSSAILWLVRDPANVSVTLDILLSTNMVISLLIGVLIIKPAGEKLPEQAAAPELREMESELTERLEATTGQLKRDAVEGVEDPPPSR